MKRHSFLGLLLCAGAVQAGESLSGWGTLMVAETKPLEVNPVMTLLSPNDLISKSYVHSRAEKRFGLKLDSSFEQLARAVAALRVASPKNGEAIAHRIETLRKENVRLLAISLSPDRAASAQINALSLNETLVKLVDQTRYDAHQKQIQTKWDALSPRSKSLALNELRPEIAVNYLLDESLKQEFGSSPNQSASIRELTLWLLSEESEMQKYYIRDFVEALQIEAESAADKPQQEIYPAVE